MSRTLHRWTGTGTGGDVAVNDGISLDGFLQPAKENFDLWLAGVIQSGTFAGGSETEGIDASATGDKRLLHWCSIPVRNAGAQISGFSDTNGAVLVAQFRYRLRVSNGAISVTPKIWYASTESGLISAPTVATISGEAACSATNDDYSGADQIQSVAFTMPSGLKYFGAGLTIGGTPAAGYQVWARAVCDVFVSLP